MSPATLALILAALLLVVSGTMYVLQRRQRAQVEALLERLGQLQPERIVEQVQEVPPQTGSDDQPPVTCDDAAPSADVLAGKTSYVRRTVEGEVGAVASLAEQTIICVHNHLADNLTPGQLAEELFVSLRTLERGLAASLDCTPSQLILAMKMREAKRLLASGQYRVNEVASRLGFASPYHFSRRFKAFYRVAPSQLIER